MLKIDLWHPEIFSSSLSGAIMPAHMEKIQVVSLRCPAVGCPSDRWGQPSAHTRPGHQSVHALFPQLLSADQSWPVISATLKCCISQQGCEINAAAGFLSPVLPTDASITTAIKKNNSENMYRPRCSPFQVAFCCSPALRPEGSQECFFWCTCWCLCIQSVKVTTAWDLNHRQHFAGLAWKQAGLGVLYLQAFAHFLTHPRSIKDVIVDSILQYKGVPGLRFLLPSPLLFFCSSAMLEQHHFQIWKSISFPQLFQLQHFFIYHQFLSYSSSELVFWLC